MEHKSVAKIISWNIDCEAICASAAKISTTSGNAIEIFEKCKSNPQNTDLVKKVLQSGHRSVIEHAVFSIAFWDVSAFVEQFLIECRLASFTVKSRRYVNFSNLGYFVPPALSGKSLHLYCEYMDLLFSGYRSLLESGIPKEDARFLLPYSFCSNFYCTINARELINLISSIIYGRGQNVPELQDIARQLILQIGDIFPVLLSELDCQAGAPRHNCETLPFILSKSLEFVYAEDAGSVQLLQAPLHPADILKHAFSCMRPYSNSEFNIGQIVASDRPRELEQLSYTFAISNITLSGITHLVRHRMQSVLIPSIQTINHSCYIIPRSIQQDNKANDFYMRTLARANDILTQVEKDDALKKYGYYFALSGNVMNVMTTINARELMLFIRLRSCNRAQWEIHKVSTEMLTLLQQDFHELFKYYGPTCVLKGACPEGNLSCGKMHEVIREFQTLENSF